MKENRGFCYHNIDKEMFLSSRLIMMTQNKVCVCKCKKSIPRQGNQEVLMKSRNIKF